MIGMIQRPKQSGQAMVEMVIISFVTLLLLFGIIQFALLYNAKTILNYATYEAARIGALNYSHPESMRLALAQKLAILEPVSSLETESDYEKLINQREQFLVAFDSVACIKRLNPPNDAGGHWLELHKTPQSQRGIANDHLLYRDPVLKGAAVQSIQDANLLKISVTYCAKMMVPIISQVIKKFMLSGAHNLALFNKQCYQANRFPMVAHAMMRMQTPVGQYGYKNSDCEDLTSLSSQLGG